MGSISDPSRSAVCQECRVSHGLIEGAPQQAHPFLRNSGRRRQGSCDRERRDMKRAIGSYTACPATRSLRSGACGQIGILAHADLHQNIEPAVTNLGGELAL